MRSAGQNGAGIRYQSGNLTIRDCLFRNNQDGILGAPDASGTILIDHSEFDHNGDARGPGAGYTHNMYIGAVGRFDLENSYTHDAVIGHEIKSRALVTIINNTRIVDGPTGTSSYSIDLPNGGAALITNDQIEQGPDGQNPILIAFGEEGSLVANSSLTIRNTLIENDLATPAALGVWNATSATATLGALRLYGLASSQIVSGPASIGTVDDLTTEPVISQRHPY